MVMVDVDGNGSFIVSGCWCGHLKLSLHSSIDPVEHL